MLLLSTVLLTIFFQSSCPGDFDVTPTNSRWLFHVQVVFHSSLTKWRDNATKLYLFLDDIFKPNHMLFGVCTADDLFQSSPLESSPVQSSPAIVDGLL